MDLSSDMLEQLKLRQFDNNMFWKKTYDWAYDNWKSEVFIWWNDNNWQVSYSEGWLHNVGTVW